MSQEILYQFDHNIIKACEMVTEDDNWNLLVIGFQTRDYLASDIRGKLLLSGGSVPGERSARS